MPVAATPTSPTARPLAAAVALCALAACSTPQPVTDASPFRDALDADATAPASDAPVPFDASDARTVPADAAPDATPDATPADAPADAAPPRALCSVPLGAHWSSDGARLRVAVYSSRATRVELWLYAAPTNAPARLTRVLARAPGEDCFTAEVPRDMLAAAGLVAPFYYGYRAWGPNWTYDPAWTPGSAAGFVADVDAAGNRFDPNKLLADPYARELSHDPITPAHRDFSVYLTGPDHRARDSGPVAPKGVVLPLEPARPPREPGPPRPFRDDVVYEVHLRGFTMRDPTVPAEARGTYAGAAARAPYLRSLGVTAVEFLPLHETPNDANDVAPDDARGDNYWGYSSLSFFAPDRRYARDRSPGGPTRELREMVRAFHREGIKVYVDVVYNHTAEPGIGGSGASTGLLSWRGLDNAAYYELAEGGRFLVDNTGVSGNVNAAHEAVRAMVLDSLRYWHEDLGVDGFRFDLASVLGNRCATRCFAFDAGDARNVLQRAARELPSRPADGGPGVDLIAEPWAIGAGTYQLGRFPAGWAEWNDRFRDAVRRDQNRLGSEDVLPSELVRRLAGSPDFFGDDGRRPWHSVNFVVAHDGFTLRDLYAYNAPRNDQPWPYGPSNGGSTNNISWDQGGDATRQRQAARTGLALLLLSAGVPMITGGDEMLRTQYGNNNPYNLDSPAMWLDWSDADTHARFADFARRMLRFRAAHPALRPAAFWRGRDGDGNGLADVAWLRETAEVASDAYLANPSNHFLAWRLDGAEAGDAAASIYVAYNGWDGAIRATVPAPGAGRGWYRVADTAAWMEPQGNASEPGTEHRLGGRIYDLAPRSLLVLLER